MTLSERWMRNLVIIHISANCQLLRGNNLCAVFIPTAQLVRTDPASVSVLLWTPMVLVLALVGLGGFLLLCVLVAREH